MKEVKHREYCELRYTFLPYFKRILYLKPKDNTRTPICILEMGSKPSTRRAFYILYIQSDALRDSFEKEIEYLFVGDASLPYNGETSLDVLDENWQMFCSLKRK